MQRRQLATLALAFVGCHSVAPPSTAAPDELPPPMMHLLRLVMDAENGWLDKTRYNQFWSYAPAEVRSEQGRVFVARMIERIMRPTIEYQRVVWRSALTSYEQKRLFRDPSIDQLEARILRDAGPAANGPFQTAFASTRRVLDAAATRSVLNSPRGPIYVTPELIEGVLSGLDASMSRVRRLVAPSYNETPAEHRLEDMGLAVLAPDPPRRRVNRTEVAGGVSVELRSAEWTVNDDVALMVACGLLGPAKTNDELHNRLWSYVESQLGGLRQIARQFEPWRGLASAWSEGKLSVAGETGGASVRAAGRIGGDRALVVLAIGASVSDAGAQRLQFERAIQLLV